MTEIECGILSVDAAVQRALKVVTLSVEAFVGAVFLGQELWGEFTILLRQVLFQGTLLHCNYVTVVKVVLKVRNNST